MGLDQYKPLVYEYLDHIAASSDAIVCVNDHIASLVLSYCQEHNIRVPDDLYVSGFDDNHEFNNRITLTSVHVNTEHIGTHLANRIVYRLMHPEDDYEYTYIRSRTITENLRTIKKRQAALCSLHFYFYFPARFLSRSLIISKIASTVPSGPSTLLFKQTS